MAAAGLEGLARNFAGEITHLLNTTICHGIRMSTVAVQPELVLAGVGLSRSDVVHKPVPVRKGGWLRVGYQLCMDDEGTFLTVSSSSFEVYADADMKLMLCRFDYERGKSGYPEAHIQLYGSSPALAAWPREGPRRELHKLHFPCGDRRYRPSLEDVIEFLVTENLAEGKDGWQTAVESGRARWRQHQLRAAVRSDPETAKDAIARLDAVRPQR